MAKNRQNSSKKHLDQKIEITPLDMIDISKYEWLIKYISNYLLDTLIWITNSQAS